MPPRKEPTPFPAEKMNVAPATAPLQLVPQKKEEPKCDCGSGIKVDADKKCQDCRVLSWTDEQLLAVKHLGAGIIGKAMHAAAEALVKRTGDGKFGPALLGIIPDAYKDDYPPGHPKHKPAA